MAKEGGMGAIFLGVVLGYFIWGNEPAYIDNIKEDEGRNLGGIFVLQSAGFIIKDRYLVAVIHGFNDSEDVCNKLAERYEREDGVVYYCTPFEAVTGGKPWWHFW